MSLSRSDFLALTPEEFNACLTQWQQWEEQRYHAGWEQARLGGYLALLPYAKKSIKEPQDLFRFAWEIPPSPDIPASKKENAEPDVNILTQEAFEAEFNRVANKYG